MRITIVDTETTGLSHDDEPISLGLIQLEVNAAGTEVMRLSRYYGLREPSVPIHPAAFRVHGMTAADLRGRRFNLPFIQPLLSSTDVAIAHNADFDARMLAQIAIYSGPWRCSYRQFPWRLPGRKRLDDVCAAFAVPRAATHNALADCEALLACLLQPAERGRTCLGALLAQQPYPVQLAPIRTKPGAHPVVTQKEAPASPAQRPGRSFLSCVWEAFHGSR